jgi:LacI family transcriptional regulator, repressor for deo operon, udp, cdd, tsx, nupC, and nupG
MCYYVTGHMTGHIVSIIEFSGKRMPKSRITIRDVAARAGVSHQTVSRVINASERVSPDTRLRVEQAIRDLGYAPNAIARYMAKGSTRTFACIAPNLTDFTFASIIDGAEMKARQNGYFLMSASASDVDIFKNLIVQLVDSRRTEGLMVINPYIDDRHLHLPPQVPIVFLGACAHSGRFNSVFLDEEEGGRLAVQHLLDLNHKRIAHITGPRREDCTLNRKAGYLSALLQAEVEPDPDLIVEGDWSATSGYRAVKQLINQGQRFTGLFAQNDRMAVGAIKALRESGLSVPEDVAVVGFDDMPLASYFDPSLTTIRQDMLSLGKAAALLLLNAVKDPDSPGVQQKMPVELVIRSSTAPNRQEEENPD